MPTGDAADVPRPTPTAESPEATPWERECGGRGVAGQRTRLRAHLDVSLNLDGMRGDASRTRTPERGHR